ncbi:MAG: hypothetical protein VB049_03470 [Candidatus Pelethousia sp.]|nr:hypothetical protein [Candidatus Pelethousia sp.]
MTKQRTCTCGKEATYTKDWLIVEADTAGAQAEFQSGCKAQRQWDAGVVRARLCKDCLQKAARKHMEENKRRGLGPTAICLAFGIIILLVVGAVQLLEGNSEVCWVCAGTLLLMLAFFILVSRKEKGRTGADYTSAEKIARGQDTDMTALDRLLRESVPGGIPAGSAQVPDSAYMLMDGDGRINYNCDAGFEIKSRFSPVGGKPSFYAFALPRQFSILEKHPLADKWNEFNL